MLEHTGLINKDREEKQIDCCNNFRCKDKKIVKNGCLYSGREHWNKSCWKSYNWSKKVRI